MMKECDVQKSFGKPVPLVAAALVIMGGQLGVQTMRSLGAPVTLSDHLMSLSISLGLLGTTWGVVRLFQRKPTPLVRASQLSFLALGALMALMLALSARAMDKWHEGGGSAVLLNPRYHSIAHNTQCTTPDQFIAARELSDGNAIYRCGPGMGDFIIWPFETTWIAPKVWK